MTSDAATRGGSAEGAPRTVLAIAGSAVERSLLQGWVADEEAEGALDVVWDPDSEGLAERLAGDASRFMFAAKVVWLPPERGGSRTARFTDLLSVGDPRKPRGRAQEKLARGHPDRWRVLVGEGATVADLRKRYSDGGGARPGREDLATWSRRQADLSLEVASREIPGNRYKSPSGVIDEICASARFRADIAVLAPQVGLSEAQTLDKAKSALGEMVAGQDPLAMDLMDGFMSAMYSRAFEVKVDETGLDELHRLNDQHALVFLPSHRSYVDSPVLGEALARHGFPPNHIMGGANLSFWPMGSLGRRSGVVFIRRSFGDDVIYKSAMREYFAFLVEKRFNLEWYFEGGRSRTGKLREPRLGLLRYLSDALSVTESDLYLVPVSITYDHLREVRAMAREQAGGEKAAEGLSWLAGYIRSQQKPSGSAYVRFGEPLALRDRLAPAGSDEAEVRVAIAKVGFEVATRINRATPVTANSLMTLALLGIRDRALTLAEVRAVLRPILAYVSRRRLPTVGLERLDTDDGVRAVLDRLTKVKVVTTYAGGLEPVYAIEEGQHLVAAFYRNGAIHWFVDRAIVEICVLKSAAVTTTATELVDVAAGWQEARRLRDLLKFEFFFPDTRSYSADLEAEMAMVDPDWHQRTANDDEARQLLIDSGFLMANRVLRSFFDAQLVVAERLAARSLEAAFDEKAFVEECIGVGRQMLLQGRIYSPESVSKEQFASALRLARNQELVEPGAEDLAERRQAFVRELTEVVALVAKAAELDAVHWQEPARA